MRELIINIYGKKIKTAQKEDLKKKKIGRVKKYVSDIVST